MIRPGSSAEAASQPVGCKLGYAAEDGSLYSWLCRVLPAHRKTGLAQLLPEAQEAWASAHGFVAVTVKSMNRYPAMLRLLIRNGYHIRRVEYFGDRARERIHFIKPLFTSPRKTTCSFLTCQTSNSAIHCAILAVRYRPFTRL